MGNTNRINLDIGKPSFDDMPVAQTNDVTCYDNCRLVTVQCDFVEGAITDLIKIFEVNSIHFKCPIQYYNCSNNIATNKILLSGYYVNQRLLDGSRVEKPLNGIKCSHGGWRIFDD